MKSDTRDSILYHTCWIKSVEQYRTVLELSTQRSTLQVLLDPLKLIMDHKSILGLFG